MSAPARALRTQVNGANPNNNVTRVDGAVNIFLWLPHHTVYVPSAASIETVSISTASFDAEQGMAGGAAVTVATKSGTYGYTRFDQPAFGFDYGKNYGTEVWKIPGTNGGAQYANDIKYSGMLAIYTGFTGWGQLSTPLPWWRNDRSQTYSTNFSRIFQAHELRFRFDMVHHARNHWQPETANPRGGTARTPNTYAAALLGLVSSYNKSVQFFLMETREWQFGWYFRDRWQVSRRLTLNLGLRYEYYPLMTRGNRAWDSPSAGTRKPWCARATGSLYDPLPFSRPLRGL